MNSPEQEPSSSPISFFRNFQELVQRIVQKENLPVDQANAKAVNTIRRKVRESTKDGALQGNAKLSIDKLRSDNEAIRKGAQTRLRGQVYQAEDLVNAQENVRAIQSVDSKLIPDYIKRAIPDVTAIQNPEVAAFVTTMASLPDAVRKDPHVVLKETTRLYYSLKWTELSSEAYAEAMNVIKQSYDVARTNGDIATLDKDFSKAVDNRINLYRTNRMEPIPDDRRTKPNEFRNLPKNQEGKIDVSSKEFQDWKSRRVAELQHETLEEVLMSYQGRLDVVADIPMQQRSELNDLKKELDRLKKMSKIDDKVNKVPLITNHAINAADAQRYIELATRQQGEISVKQKAVEDLERQAKTDTSKQDALKIEKELRRTSKPTKETVDDSKNAVKATLQGKQPTEYDWLVDPATVDGIQSADVAQFINKVLSNPEVYKDPKMLTTESLRLVFATGTLSPEIRTEAAGIIRKVRAHMDSMLKADPKSGLLIEAFDTLLYGKPLGDPPVNLRDFIPDHLTDPRLIDAIREARYHLEADPGYFLNKTQISKDLSRYMQGSYEVSVPVEQARIAAEMYDQLKNRAEQLLREQRVKESSRGGVVIAWSEVKNLLPREWQEKVANSGRLDTDSHMLNAFSEEERVLLTSGPEGIREWFSNFIFGVYGIGRDQQHPELPDTMRWHSFKEYMKWLHGDSDAGELFLRPLELVWNDYGRQEFFLKTLTYQPADIKDKIGALRKMLGADLDAYGRVDGANKTISIYKNALKNLLGDKQNDLNASLTELFNVEEKGVTPFWNASGPKISQAEYYVGLTLRDMKDQLVLPSERVMIVGENQSDYDLRIARLVDERKKTAQQIRIHIDKVQAGTMLKDTDVLVFNEIGSQIAALKQNIVALEAKADEGPLDQKSQDKLDRYKKELDLRQQQFNKIKPENIVSDHKNGDIDSLTVRAAYSPLENEVYETFVAYVHANPEEMSDFIFQESEGPIAQNRVGKVKEWKVRQAIIASRMHLIASGDMVTMNSFEVTRPLEHNWKFEALVKRMKEMDEYKRMGIRDVRLNFGEAKSVMWSTFMEDIVRIYNPELFQQRFNMGDVLGQHSRDILATNLLKDKGYKLTKSKEWLKDNEEFRDAPIEVQRMRQLMEFAEENTGISFTEILRPEFFKGGGAFDATTWRLENQYDVIKQRYLSQEGATAAMWENQAMGIQFILAQGEAEKLQILNRMLDRTPSLYIQMLAGDEINKLRAAVGLTGEHEWKMLQRSLSMAEMDLWSHDHLLATKISLTNMPSAGSPEGAVSDFDTYVGKYLRNLNLSEAQIDVSRNFMAKLRERVLDVDNKGVRVPRGERLIDYWAKHKFPLTLTTADLNWAESNFFTLGSAMLDRRGRDNMAMAQARDLINKIMSDPTILSPLDPKETIKALVELRGAVNTYADHGVAENVVKQMARIIIEVNRNRCINPAMDGLKGFIGFFPGAVSIMKNLSETDFRGLANSDFLNVMTGGAWKHIAGHKMAHWPHSISQAISYSIGSTGAEGNAWDEFKIQGFIATLDRSGLFLANRDIPFDLRKEFKTGLGWRALGTFRKYWWVVPMTTVAMAVFEATEEEKHKRH